MSYDKSTLFPIKPKPAAVFADPRGVARMAQTRANRDALNTPTDATAALTANVVDRSVVDEGPVAIVPGLLYAGTVNTLVAFSAGGKTTITTTLAQAVATGTAWQGINVKQGEVWYLAAESSESVNKLLTTWETVERDGAVTPALHLIKESGAHLSPATITQWLDEVRTRTRKAPRLIFVDTLRYAANGDYAVNSNATRLLGELRRAAKELRCAILLLTHFGRNGVDAEGANVWTTSVDNEFRCGVTGSRAELMVKRARIGGEAPTNVLSWDLVTTADGALFAREALPDDDHEESLTTEIFMWLVANPGSTRSAVLDNVGTLSSETIAALDRLVASKTIIIDPVARTYHVG